MHAIVDYQIPSDPEVLKGLERFGKIPAEISGLIVEARAIARPRAMARVAGVEPCGSDGVFVEGRRFSSKLVARNLANIHRIFPFVATAGRELDAWAGSQTDPIRSFWANAIAEWAVGSAMEYVREAIKNRFQTGELARMNPGSLADWRIEEQAPLFSVLGDTSEIGVRLTDSFWMEPVHSVSGIFFADRTGFENCRLCPRESCRLRKVSYDPERTASLESE